MRCELLGFVFSVERARRWHVGQAPDAKLLDAAIARRAAKGRPATTQYILDGRVIDTVVAHGVRFGQSDDMSVSDVMSNHQTPLESTRTDSVSLNPGEEP